MQTFETSCGHVVKIVPVQSRGGSQEGRWQVRISGPSITLQCGFKCLYADANPYAVVEIVAEYLRANASVLRKPLARPRASYWLGCGDNRLGCQLFIHSNDGTFQCLFYVPQIHQ